MFFFRKKSESFPDWDKGWVQGVKCLEHRRGSSMRPKCSNVVAPADSLKLLLFGFYLGSYINFVITFRGQQERFCVYDKYTNLMKFRKMYNHYYYLVLKVQKVYHILHSRHHNILTCAAYSSVCRYPHAQFVWNNSTTVEQFRAIYVSLFMCYAFLMSVHIRISTQS